MFFHYNAYEFGNTKIDKKQVWIETSIFNRNKKFWLYFWQFWSCSSKNYKTSNFKEKHELNDHLSYYLTVI